MLNTSSVLKNEVACPYRGVDACDGRKNFFKKDRHMTFTSLLAAAPCLPTTTLWYMRRALRSS